VARVVHGLLSLRPLLDVLDPPVRVAATGGGDCGPVAALVERLTSHLGLPPLAVCPRAAEEQLGPFERIVGRPLDLDPASWPAAPGAGAPVERIADAVVAGSFDSFSTCSLVTSRDGARIRTYAAGPRPGRPVVIASACGMPARLAEGWMRFLARERFVVTWESRHLFGDGGRSETTGWDLDAQAGDLLAVLDHYRLEDAHVVGLCGGAVIALAAAVADGPSRISSLSLWHGDYELGPGCAKTDHQRDLKELMAMAMRSPASARTVHAVLCQAVLAKVAPELAHLVLYPYATPDLMFRYCRLNWSIMDAAVDRLLDPVAEPVLVVTSRDDLTAHPAGSAAVAERLRNGTLHVRPHGDHISLFHAGPEVVALTEHFIGQC
jgi:3-oxoadipate enol-lactonase